MILDSPDSVDPSNLSLVQHCSRPFKWSNELIKANSNCLFWLQESVLIVSPLHRRLLNPVWEHFLIFHYFNICCFNCRWSLLKANPTNQQSNDLVRLYFPKGLVMNLRLYSKCGLNLGQFLKSLRFYRLSSLLIAIFWRSSLSHNHYFPTLCLCANYLKFYHFLMKFGFGNLGFEMCWFATDFESCQLLEHSFKLLALKRQNIPFLTLLSFHYYYQKTAQGWIS